MMNTIHVSRVQARSFLSTLAATLFLLLPTGCRSAPGGAGDVSLGTYYTQFPMQIDRDTCRSTNYRGGTTAFLLPINSEVEFTGARRYRFNMRMEDGRIFRFEHIKKHTRDTPQASFDTFFGAEPVDLSGFTAAEQAAIEKGKPEVGMSRDAVLTACGPPPATGTASLDARSWKYWSTRFDTFLVHFDEDGKVSSIQE